MVVYVGAVEIDWQQHEEGTSGVGGNIFVLVSMWGAWLQALVKYRDTTLMICEFHCKLHLIKNDAPILHIIF